MTEALLRRVPRHTRLLLLKRFVEAHESEAPRPNAGLDRLWVQLAEEALVPLRILLGPPLGLLGPQGAGQSVEGEAWLGQLVGDGPELLVRQEVLLDLVDVAVLLSRATRTNGESPFDGWRRPVVPIGGT